MTVPGAAVEAAARVLMRQAGHDLAYARWQDHADNAREVLEAAAPVIAAAERQRIREWLAAVETELIHPETAEEVAAVRWRDVANLLDGAPQERRQKEIAERAEEIHAEHHAGYIVPDLDSCGEHTRAEYEALVADLLDGDRPLTGMWP